MATSDFIDKIVSGDSLDLLSKLDDNSVDLVLTDPPYFLDKLDAQWNHSKVSNNKNLKVIKSLPAGMKFDPNQGKKLYEWYLKVSTELIRIIKPGGFFFSFSSPRLYHRLVSAVDDAGFEIRDSFVWLYTQNQVKAMGLNHFIDKMPLNEKGKRELSESLKSWKTPQIKSCFEPIAVAQKPKEETYLHNMQKHKVGLLNIDARVGDDMQPSNVISTDYINNAIDRVFLVPKPTKQEKQDYNSHRTVKPLSLCEHLIRLSAYDEDAVILDPFVGSGTTALAAKRMDRRYIGMDINKEYVKIAKRRIADFINAEESQPEDEKEDIYQQSTKGQLKLIAEA